MKRGKKTLSGVLKELDHIRRTKNAEASSSFEKELQQCPQALIVGKLLSEVIYEAQHANAMGDARLLPCGTIVVPPLV